MNKCAFKGNLTHDPELRYTSGGSAVVDFTLAVNESYTNKNGEKVENTDFFDFSCWGKRGEALAKYTKKGDPLLVSDCKAKQERWDDKDTAQKRSKIKFVVTDFEFLSRGKPNTDNSPSQTSSEPEPEVVEEEDSDDIPF